MKEVTSKLRRKRIFYPPSSWFPLQSIAFETVFPKLLRKRSAHLYIAMYERTQRQQCKSFAANLTDLGKLIDCDSRTVRPCIIELVRKRFVKMVYEGSNRRSRTDKPRFTVPLAMESLDPGFWFPVPRFLVTQYLKKFKGSIVLIALLYHQHLMWKRDCWPGAQRLTRILGMNSRTVYAYLNTMGHQAPWERLGNGLPWPLAISYSPDGKTRHYSVRAAQFFTPPGGTKPAVKLRQEFAIHFGYETAETSETGDRDD